MISAVVFTQEALECPTGAQQSQAQVRQSSDNHLKRNGPELLSHRHKALVVLYCGYPSTPTIQYKFL